MKSRLFKKMIAGVMALAMLAQFAVILPITASADEFTYLHKQDFEGGATTGWTSPNSAVTIETDANSSINKYLKFVPNSTSGNRNAYYKFDSAVQIAEPTVLEFDASITPAGDRAGEIVIVGNSNTPAANSSITSGYVLKLDFPIGSANVTINNGKTTTTTLEKATWFKVKTVNDFTAKTVVVTITSLDGAVEHYSGKVNMDSSASFLGSMNLLAPRGASMINIDNLQIRQAEASDLVSNYHTVTYDVNGTTTIESVKNNENLIDIPSNPSKPGTPEGGGYKFMGWKIDDSEDVISSEELSELAITSSITVTAVFENDITIIEGLTGIQFSKKPNVIPTLPQGENERMDYPVELSLTGEWGNNLALAENQKGELNVDWSIAGFDTLQPDTTDEDGNIITGDSYITLSGFNETSTTANINIRNGVVNYFALIKATVTYGDELNGTNTFTAQFPFVVLANKTSDANDILPLPGYPEGFTYSDKLTGYQAVDSGNSDANTDAILGGWSTWGSNSGRKLFINSENDNTFLTLTTGTRVGTSTFASNKIGAQTEQIIVEQELRFYAASTGILFKQANPVTWNDNATAVSISFDGSKIIADGKTVADNISTAKWYKIVFSPDASVGTYWVEVKDADGTSLGKVTDIPFTNAGATSPAYLVYRLLDNAANDTKMDIDNVKVYKPTIDTFTISSTPSTVNIPEDGAVDATSTLHAIIKDANGSDLSGIVTWELQENYENVSILANAENSHSATLTVKEGASAGEVVVIAKSKGQQSTTTVNLTSNQENVAFVNPQTSVTIPFDNAPVNVVYKAEVRTGQGEAINGRAISYKLVDKTGVELTNLTGITFDKQTATLSVTKDAKATVVTLVAEGLNSDNQVISKSVVIDIHGQSFDFGLDNVDDVINVADGYTAVTTNDIYTEAKGYGFRTVAGLTAESGLSSDPLTADNITGTSLFVFSANVPNGNYSVTAQYQGSVKAEPYLGSAVVGFTVGETTELTTSTFDVPVSDGVLDLTFEANGSANPKISSIVITKLADKTPREKPAIYVVGDSTSANNSNGQMSWGNKAGAIALALGDNFTVSNTGRAGRGIVSYYNEAMLPNVLLQIRPGDYVTVNMGINGNGASKELFETMFRNYYVEAIAQRGAIPVIMTHTPDGPVTDRFARNYDAETNQLTIDGAGRRNEAYNNQIIEIGTELAQKDGYYFYDLGLVAINLLNSKLADGSLTIETIQSWYTDHNHYLPEAAEIYATLIIEEITRIHEERNKPAFVPEIGEVTFVENQVSVPVVNAEDAENAKISVFVAEYDSNNVMVGVNLVNATISSDNATVTVDYTRTSSENTVKVFVWSGKTLAPYTAPIVFANHG